MTWRMKIQLNKDVMLMTLLKGKCNVSFPDSIEEVNQQGFDNCERCLGKRLFRFGVRLNI